MVNQIIKPFMLFTLMISLVASVIILTQFQARENDSRLYTKFTTQLTKEKPLKEIVALEWQGLSEYTDPNNPYVRDHFIGQFIFPVIISKLGFPSEYSLYFLNTIYRLLFIFIFFLVVKEFIEKEKALVVLWALQLCLINFTYQLRANHEQFLLLCLICTILGYIKINHGAIYRILFVIGFIFSFLTKGLAAITLLPILFSIWFILYRKQEDKKYTNFFWILISFFALVITLFLYEVWFQAVTGYPFLAAYFKIQVYGRSIKDSASIHPFVLQKMINIFYYLSRALINALPWILLLVLSLGTKFYKTKSLKLDLSVKTKQLIWILINFVLVYILLFSLSNRLAQRYIFPAYYAFTTLVLILLINQSYYLQKFQAYLQTKLKACYVLLFTWGFLTLAAVSIYFIKGGHEHWLK